MAIRFAAASGLALAAALMVASPARAQFFRFFDISPRQVAVMLEDDGYQLRGPLTRRGDVYVCDAVSLSGRSVRLVLSAHDGHILERFAAPPRWRDAEEDDAPRMRRSRDLDDDRDTEGRSRRRDMALGDLFTPPSRIYGNDGVLSSKPTPPATLPDAPLPKPKPHAAKKHKEPAVVKAPAPEPTPSAEAPKTDAGSSVAAVAPNPAPEPKKPAVEQVKPAEGPRVIEINRPAAETKPAPAPTPATTKAEVEKRPVETAPAPVKPKSEVKPAKKLNDLPVGTLD